MSYQGTVLAVAALYLVVCLAVGLWPSKQQSASVAGYVAGDRALGLVLMYFVTGATIFSAFTFLGMPGIAYTQGAAAFYILSYGILGFVPFYFLGPRAARVGRARGFVTQGEMIAQRFGNRAIAPLMAIVSLVAFIPYVAVQMRGAGLIANVISGGSISTELGAAVVYAVVLAYVWKSGLMGVGWTNVLQGVLMITLAWALGLYVPHAMYGGIGAMFDRLAEARPEMLVAPGIAKAGGAWSWSEYSSAVLVSTIGFSCWPHLFMKAFTAKDDRTLRRSVVLYPTFLVMQVPILLLGFAAVLHPTPPAVSEQVIPHLLLELGVPAVAVGLFAAGGLAAAMGGDALGHAAASIAVRDGLVRGLGLALEPLRERAWIRAALVLVLGAAYVIVVFYDDQIVWLLLWAYGPIIQFMPGLVAALYSRRTTAAGVLAGLGAGILLTLAYSLRLEWRPWPVHAGLYGLVVNVALLALVSARTQPGDRARDDEFLRIASTR